MSLNIGGLAWTLEGIGLILWLIHTIGLLGSLYSLFNRTDDSVSGDSRVLWALVILLLPFGWVAYVIVGRRSESEGPVIARSLR